MNTLQIYTGNDSNKTKPQKGIREEINLGMYNLQVLATIFPAPWE
jgi:hypothetical protein